MVNKETIEYRPDVDGLRALAVIAVILFHSGIPIFSGGFIGVDIFFVISGYLITTVVITEINSGTFKFSSFYKRRIARLLPAVTLTLLFTTFYASLTFSPERLTDLGKDLFFSSLGILNLHLANGVNYFSQENVGRPLIHFWSLAVEEQFYLFWPILLILTLKKSAIAALCLGLLIFFASIVASTFAVKAETTGSYYLLQYRAFELLIGCFIAILETAKKIPRVNERVRPYIAISAITLLALPLFMLDETSSFPGLNALWPCMGTALLIAYPDKRYIYPQLSRKFLVFTGLLSYPLYLYHQPVLVFLETIPFKSPYISLALVLGISFPLAWLTFRFIEKPIRATIKGTNKKHTLLSIVALVSTIPLFAFTGLLMVKTEGLPSRMQLLNPFALQIIDATARTFHETYESGYQITESEIGEILFVGDSTAQHFVVPITTALKIRPDAVDSATRGGCVLLKNVDYIERNAAISCNDIREKLYRSKKKWDTVVISQNWRSAVGRVKNFPEEANELTRWSPFIHATLSHFKQYSNNIIIIGDHPRVTGTELLTPTVSINSDKFVTQLDNLYVNNLNELQGSREFFNSFIEEGIITTLQPVDLLCTDKCVTHNEQWPYFRDSLHFSNAATSYLSSRIIPALLKIQKQ